MIEDGGIFPVGVTGNRGCDPVRIGKVVEAAHRKIGTKDMLDGADAAYGLFLKHGLTQEGSRAARQARGGDCPVCGRQYVKDRHVNRFADLEWYRPDCTCEETEEERRSKVDQVDQVLVLAGVPDEYQRATFETWDHGAEGKVNEAMRSVYDFAKDREYRQSGMVLYGDVGTGKTRCAVSVLRRAAADGLDVQFVKMAEIVGRFVDREKGKRFVDGLLSRHMVLFDDLDKIGSLENGWVAEQVFRVFDGMLSSGRKILATSNLPDYAAFERKFGEPVMSRLVGGCRFVEFRGADYRVRRAEMDRLNRELAKQKEGIGANKKKSGKVCAFSAREVVDPTLREMFPTDDRDRQETLALGPGNMETGDDGVPPSDQQEEQAAEHPQRRGY